MISNLSTDPGTSRATRNPRPRGGARSRGFTVLAAVGAGLALLAAGCGKPREAHTVPRADLPAVRVTLRTAETKTLPIIEEVVGTVRAKLRATLEAKVSGRIDKLTVTLGQRVSRGELLVRLDAPEVKARLDQAEAGLQQAERDWKRASSLLAQQAVTRSEYDAADARYQVAKGAVAEARAMVAYVEILAPFDGVVTRKWVDVGDLAAPGKALIDLEDPAALQLEADVPEAIASRVRREARMRLQADTAPGEWSGVVSEIAPGADPVSRTVRVKLDLPNGAALRSGQFARLLVPAGESSSLRVPASAVVQRGQMEIVFVAANQRAVLHLVKTGRRIGEETEILSGLANGDPVVVDAANQLADGQPVEAK